MSVTSIMAVDDSSIFLEGLCTVLEYGDPEISVVCSTSDSEEAIELFINHEVDVVLLDIKMPGINGVDLAKTMLEIRPEVCIIMLTTFDDMDLISSALDAGARGYFLKDAPADQIIDAVKSGGRGSVHMSPSVARKLAMQQTDSGDDGKQRGNAAELSGLSRRELEILRKIGEGKSNYEISEELFLSEKTIRNYVSHIYDIMGFSSRSKAVVWAKEHESELMS